MTRSTMPLLFEKTRQGHRGSDLPALDVPRKEGLLPKSLTGGRLNLPELSEIDAVRHYTNLARRNFGVDNGFYPLGSCTMKYNPKINEEIACSFDGLHPYLPADMAQGAVDMMFDLERALCEIVGMDQFTLQPAAGAHGELTGLMMIKAWHESRGQDGRDVMIVPDSAHGTNPASAALAGFKIREIKSAPDGGVDLDALRAAVDERTAGLMLTNPSTLGLFEINIAEIADIIHKAGGLLYYDGANLNAIMGVVRPGDMGFDVVHLNLHKTFATPHGGGGPGSGPVGVKAQLAPFLPMPVVLPGEGGKARLEYDRPQSIGRMKNFYGNFSIMARAYAYIYSLGAEGLKEASENAVLNANYLQHRLKDTYELAHDRICMHECVFTPGELLDHGVHTMDIAKALIDRGYHPPTIYFPLIVKEAMMFEPTETESRETLDAFADAMIDIARVGKENPEALHQAPVTTPVGRPDDVTAARSPIVCYHCE